MSQRPEAAGAAPRLAGEAPRDRDDADIITSGTVDTVANAVVSRGIWAAFAALGRALRTLFRPTAG